MNRLDTEFSIAAGVARLVLAKPEIRNALTDIRMLGEILSAIDEAEADPEVSTLVITGKGSAFSAGGNVREMQSREGMFSGSPEQLTESYRSTIQQLTRRMMSTDLATIASVNGAAVGAGFDLVLACDLRIGSTRARFAHTFVDLGIVPGDGGGVDASKSGWPPARRRTRSYGPFRGRGGGNDAGNTSRGCTTRRPRASHK